IVQSLLVRVAGGTFALPIHAVTETLRVEPEQIQRVNQREAILLRDSVLPLVSLGHVFGVTHGGPRPNESRLVVAVHAANRQVGLGEAHALKAEPGVDAALVAYGLGSCVALCLWDAKARVAGMAHIVVPGEDPNGAPNPRFARSALPALVSVMRAYGSRAEPR